MKELKIIEGWLVCGIGGIEVMYKIDISKLLHQQAKLTREETIKECMKFMETMNAEASPECNSCKFTARQLSKLYKRIKKLNQPNQ